MTRRALIALIAAVATACFAAPASAYWPANGFGVGFGTSALLANGNQPTAKAASTTVTLQWTQTDFQGAPLGSFGGGGYLLRRSPASGGLPTAPAGSCAATASGAAAVLSCQDTGVPAGSWRYTVTPILNSWTGGESAPSANVSVDPSAPVFSSATAQNPAPGVSTGDISLTWQPVSGATGYDVYRRAGAGAYNFSAPINGATPVATTSFTDGNAALTGGVTYSYLVRARAGTTSSINSNEQSATAIARASAPASATSTAAPAASINLTWIAASGATGYNVYRRTSSGSFNYAFPLNGATPVTGTAYADTSSIHGTTYVYVVRAVTSGANGVTLESFDSTATLPIAADGVSPNAVSIVDPGSLLRGSVTLSGSASDVGSGIASLRFQGIPAAGGAWTDLCVATTSQFLCAWNTSLLADGLYDLRTLATDVAGNATASAIVTNRRIDNTPPSLTMNDPGQYLRLTINLTASANDTGSGLQSLAIQRAATGSSTWTTVCTVASSPASCPLNTTTLADGGYDLRAVATDVAGNVGTSTIVVNRIIDNTAPAGTDVQTIDGAGNTSKPEAGDQLVYTFSEPMLAASVLNGWNGAATSVTVRFTNGNPDVVTVWDATNSTQTALGTFRSGKKYVISTVLFSSSTMVLSGNTITVTLGVPSGATSDAKGATTLQWLTSSSATDLAGNPLGIATIAETGALDADF